MNIKALKTYDEIAQSFDALSELRPHLTDKKLFVAQVMQQQKEGYEIIALEDQEELVACIGFRLLTTLAWGKYCILMIWSQKKKPAAKDMVKFY